MAKKPKTPPTAEELRKQKEKRDKIVAQSIKEIEFNRRYKQGKVKNWQKNEIMLYGTKQPATESRSNVDLARMQEYVNTLLSKIDNPLVFKFLKRKMSQLARVERLNALRDSDQQTDNWDIKDLVGKKQGVVYGRAIYSYFADSHNGYQAHLGNVDVYDYLIDPSGGGIDLECALNMGDYGVVYTKEQLEGMKDDEMYDKDVITELLAGTGNNTESPTEETNKRIRMYGQNTIGQKNNAVDSDNKYKFWRWCTTFYDEETKTSERYYLLLQERASKAIRVCPLTDLFPATKEFPLGPWPYWSWAAFPDLTEFWTPGYCDIVREILQAQAVTINQMLDNAEAQNKPQKIINVNSLENLAELKYRRDGVIRTKNNIDANRAIQFVRPPLIETPLKVFNILENITEKASGVTSQVKGTEAANGTATIYAGNQEASADRFGLLNRSYSFGYKRFARLWELGVRTHLVKKVAIDIIGPEGVETEKVSKRDIFRGSDDFAILVEASNAETQTSLLTQRAQVALVQSWLTAQASPTAPKIINEKKAFEFQAKTVGIEQETIEELTDTTSYGNSKLMAEVARDIERLLEDEPVVPNMAANNAYRQKLLNFMIDHHEDMDTAQFNRMSTYFRSLAPIVEANEARALNNHAINVADAMSKPPIPGAESKLGPPGNGTEALAPLTAPSADQPLGETINGQ